MVRAAVGELPSDQREVIEMAYFHGLSYREVARADLRETAAEAIAVDHGNGRLGERRESLPAPLI